MNKLKAIIFVISILVSTVSHAGISFLDPTTLAGGIPADVANAAIKTFGIIFAHRPFDGAVSMFSNNAIDLKFEVSMIKIGSGLSDALTANGMSTGSSTSTLAMPMAKVHIRKALSSSMDAGVSAIYYGSNHALGGDLKIVLSQPEEGINTALRIGYSYATASLLYLKSVSVYSPEFGMSRKLDFAEPYLGFGGRIISGSVSVPITVAPFPTINLDKSGSGMTAYAYTGVKFQVLGPKGFRIGMEGHYDVSGFSSLGFMFGIGF